MYAGILKMASHNSITLRPSNTYKIHKVGFSLCHVDWVVLPKTVILPCLFFLHKEVQITNKNGMVVLLTGKRARFLEAIKKTATKKSCLKKTSTALNLASVRALFIS